MKISRNTKPVLCLDKHKTVVVFFNRFQLFKPQQFASYNKYCKQCSDNQLNFLKTEISICLNLYTFYITDKKSLFTYFTEPNEILIVSAT